MITDPDDQSAREKAESPRPARYWKNQVEAALKREEKWRKRAAKVVKRYNDERDGDTVDMRTDDDARVNMLWSNTEVLKSALFADLGKPDVARNFPKQGRDNKVARQAALILERALSACNERYDPETEIEEGVTDYLLGGRGQCWLEYEAEVEEYDEDEGEDQGQRIANQEVEICHVPYDDWTHGAGRKWEQVPWVARRHLMTKDDVAEQFSDDVAEKIPLNYVLAEGKLIGGRSTDASEGAEDFKRAQLWEIWDKRSKSRIYVADGYQFEVERTADPYKLEGFFPCPRPLYGVKTPGSLNPRPEYLQYEDQCLELDNINTRIGVLARAMKVCGIYASSIGDDGKLSDLGMLDDGQFIPFKDWQSLAQGGGLKAAFQTLDTAPYAQAIQVLAQRGAEIIQLIYEVTGISDIVRGATDPRETASAQRLKARFGTQRIQKRQKEVQRFVADLYRMKAELIAEHFEPQQLAEMSGIDIPTEAEKAMAKQLLAAVQQRQQMQQQMMAQQQQAAQAQQQGQQGAPQQQHPALPPPHQMGAPAPQPQQMAA